jgi:hypothetical protein
MAPLDAMANERLFTLTICSWYCSLPRIMACPCLITISGKTSHAIVRYCDGTWKGIILE